MKVRDAMAHTVSSVRPDDQIGTAAEAMKREGSGFIPVVEGETLVGVLTDRDIVLRCVVDAPEGHDPREMTVGDVMTADPSTVGPDAELDEAARLMGNDEIRRLPVVDGGRHLLGVLSHGNLVQATSGAGAGAAATLGVTRGA